MDGEVTDTVCWALPGAWRKRGRFFGLVSVSGDVQFGVMNAPAPEESGGFCRVAELGSAKRGPLALRTRCVLLTSAAAADSIISPA